MVGLCGSLLVSGVDLSDIFITVGGLLATDSSDGLFLSYLDMLCTGKIQ